MKQSYEAFLDGREVRRLKNEARAVAKLDKQLDRADRMIGELNGGRFYVFPVGGKYREGSRVELIDYLIRNRWV